MTELIKLLPLPNCTIIQDDFSLEKLVSIGLCNTSIQAIKSVLSVCRGKQGMASHSIIAVETWRRFETLANFSSNRTSPTFPPDCVFTVSIINDTTRRYFFISTYSIADETWKTYHI